MNIYILLLNKSSLGGIERVALNLHTTLNDTSDFNVEIVDLKDLSKRFHGGLSEPYLCYKFCQILKSEDIVISMYDRLSIELAFFKVITNKKFKLVASQHADYFANRVHTRFLRRILYQCVDSVTALTKFDMNLYNKWHKNVSYIPNPILSYPETVLPFCDRNDVVLAAGRLNKIKGFKDFINLAKLMNDSNSLKFNIFGEGEEQEVLSQHSKSIGLEPGDILKGLTTELENQFLNSKFLIVTSKRESFSMVILEAMAAGCIPISYDCPTGPRELIVNGVNGYLVKEGDLSTIKNLILELLKDTKLAKSIQVNARATATKYKSESVNKKWRKLLGEF